MHYITLVGVALGDIFPFEFVMHCPFHFVVISYT